MPDIPLDRTGLVLVINARLDAYTLKDQDPSREPTELENQLYAALMAAREYILRIDQAMVPSNTLRYAAVALESSADNGDRFAAATIRDALAGHITEDVDQETLVERVRREAQNEILEALEEYRNGRKSEQAISHATDALRVARTVAARRRLRVTFKPNPVAKPPGSKKLSKLVKQAASEQMGGYPDESLLRLYRVLKDEGL